MIQSFSRHRFIVGSPVIPTHAGTQHPVILAQAGTQSNARWLDSRLRGNDSVIAALDAESAEVLLIIRGLL